MTLDVAQFEEHARRTIDAARVRFVHGSIDLAEFEQRVELALMLEDPKRDVPAGWSVKPAFVREVRKLWDATYVRVTT